MQTYSLSGIFDQAIAPLFKHCFQLMSDGKEQLTLEGVPVYNEKAQFVGGKVINFSVTTVFDHYKNTPEFETKQQEMTTLIEMASKMPMETWGILNGIRGICRLQKEGMLETCLQPALISYLKQVLDWRTFVDVSNDYKLIDKPTNYYGVAFGIATYREMLGWDTAHESDVLYEKLKENIEAYSGEYLFMDDTPGEGRFDRYSMIIAGEIAEIFINTGRCVPEMIQAMLKKSVAVILAMANPEGTGFAYGRSTGAYGNTAILGMLATAKMIPGILTAEQEEIAYGYSVFALHNLAHFWIDSEMGLINLWKKGRRTDLYRNINRILGENLSLCLQMADYVSYFKAAKMADQCITQEQFVAALGKLPPVQAFHFSKGDYDRCLYVFRQGTHVLSLPVISGGKQRKHDSQYLTIPFEPQVIEAVPDVMHPFLMPMLKMQDGQQLSPIMFASEVTSLTQGEDTVLQLTYHGLADDLTDALTPCPMVTDQVTYRIGKETVTRTDHLICQQEGMVQEIIMEVPSFHAMTLTQDSTHLTIAEGGIRSFTTTSYDYCTLKDVANEEAYHTPHGALQQVAVWTKTENLGKEIVLEWQMSLR